MKYVSDKARHNTYAMIDVPVGASFIRRPRFDMDQEIQALEQRLSKTRQIKQGMMQELLTGRTRLVLPAEIQNHAN